MTEKLENTLLHIVKRETTTLSCDESTVATIHERQYFQKHCAGASTVCSEELQKIALMLCSDQLEH